MTVENDLLSGLPELPEGYLWRLGEKNTNLGWYDNVPYMVPALFIDSRATGPEFVQTFSSIAVTVKTEVPEIGRITSQALSRDGKESNWRYDLPVSREGVEVVGEVLYNRFTAWKNATDDPERHDLMVELDKLLESFRRLRDTWTFPDAPPYSDGLMSAYRDAAQMLAEVMRRI